jgi:muramoyltetrapeptide carboxypeptidase
MSNFIINKPELPKIYEIVKPKIRQIGDSVNVIALSDKLAPDDIIDLDKGIAILESWGLKVTKGAHLYDHIQDFSAGSANVRMKDFLTAVYDTNSKAVIMANGGYSAMDLWLNGLTDPSLTKHLRNNPKIWMGYSDSCSILNYFTRIGLTNVMGPNLAGLIDWDEKTREMVKKTLIEGLPFDIGKDSGWTAINNGQATGILVASNFSILTFSWGTDLDPLLNFPEGVILALEDIEIEPSWLNNALTMLISQKYFSNTVKGIIFGRIIGEEETYPQWGKNQKASDLLASKFNDAGINIPVAVCDVFGHHDSRLNQKERKETFYPLVNGLRVKFIVGKSCALSYQESLS